MTQEELTERIDELWDERLEARQIEEFGSVEAFEAFEEENLNSADEWVSNRYAELEDDVRNSMSK